MTKRMASPVRIALLLSCVAGPGAASAGGVKLVHQSSTGQSLTVAGPERFKLAAKMNAIGA